MTRLARLLLVALPGLLSAQVGARDSAFTVRVRVSDSASVPVAGAEVTVLRGVNDVIARTTTGSAGDAAISFRRDPGDYQVSVRKLGYYRGDRFFSVGHAEETTIRIPLTRVPTQLAPVTVTAAEEITRKRYHLSADDIENSARPIVDGADILKIRPDMMNSRAGAKLCELPRTPRDGWVESVWVNGKRVILADIDPVAIARRPSFGLKQHELPSRRALARGAMEEFTHIDTVLSILASIKSEHIAEVTYHDCFDQSVGKVRSDMAIFVVLKPGVQFRNGVGSFVAADRTAAADSATFNVDDLPRYRFRLLGVFDESTGDPLQGVSVIEPRSGLRATTTATGTVSLYFVPEGDGTLDIRRAGYRDTSIAVRISPRDTLPITLTVGKKEGGSPSAQPPVRLAESRQPLSLNSASAARTTLGGGRSNARRHTRRENRQMHVMERWPRG